jgi:peptidoglycan/xylan/chitin deacetylase (PgdA/CDA1 family)
MSSRCKIVTYHYVRDLQKSLYPQIKGLELYNFVKQVEYFRNNFNFITAEEILSTLYDDGPIPQNSILLTFDDGFKDHYLNVFPILKKLKIQGLFFPPAKAIENREVLDVHKVHFILASCKDARVIIKEIFEILSQYPHECNINAIKFSVTNLNQPARFDTKEVVFIKRLLQRELPAVLRSRITKELFHKFVTDDEESFSRELYLSLEEIEEMKENGMYFGSHGYSHEWLGYLSVDQLELEIERSLNFQSKIGNSGEDNLIMSYPYGNYNKIVIEKLSELGFKAGFTTEVGDAILMKENAFLLKRFDTNDFPQ